ncbi:MAG: four helix bundle protein [Bacteroidales bacterium]|jgi:four helix bundle protein|nr:four helix bundle protein [Bacteroidales bacterium]MBR4339855.1 four helix bundle protein [Bacteroidales bacterium]
MATKTFKELIVWQKAHAFVLKVYSFSESFPKSELYGLTSQFRRAAVSIAANIAEGYVKKSPADKLRFFNISQGSLEECSYYIILSKDLNYITEEQLVVLNQLLGETERILNTYITRIQASNS